MRYLAVGQVDQSPQFGDAGIHSDELVIASMHTILKHFIVSLLELDFCAMLTVHELWIQHPESQQPRTSPCLDYGCIYQRCLLVQKKLNLTDAPVIPELVGVGEATESFGWWR